MLIGACKSPRFIGNRMQITIPVFMPTRFSFNSHIHIRTHCTYMELSSKSALKLHVYAVVITCTRMYVHMFGIFAYFKYCFGAIQFDAYKIFSTAASVHIIWSLQHQRLSDCFCPSACNLHIFPWSFTFFYLLQRTYTYTYVCTLIPILCLLLLL